MNLKMGKLQIEEGIPNWTLGLIVLSCASPAVTLNVWPRIEAMMIGGMTSNQFGIVLLVTLSALGMTCVPFAMKKADSVSFWWTCLAFGIGLGILNYTMAVGAIGKVRDNEAGERSAIRAKAKSLELQIQEAEGARRSLPAFRWTTSAMVDTAKEAVALAAQARDQECNKVGDHCRARVTQLGNRQSELASTSSDRATTERAEHLDKLILQRRQDLISLGPIPDSPDQQATRIAAVVGALFSLGDNAAERVATGLIHFLAICAEAFALGMPRIITTALSRRDPNHSRRGTQLGRTQVDSNSQEVKNETSQTPPAPPPTPNKSQTKAQIPRTKVSVEPMVRAPVTQWKSERLIRAAGKTRTFECYSDYKAWAAVQNLQPFEFTDFDRSLEQLGIKKIEETKRTFYLEVAIKQPLKVVS